MSKIISIETAHPSSIMPNLLLVRVTTDDGLVGHGETYYTPGAVAALPGGESLLTDMEQSETEKTVQNLKAILDQ